MFPRICISLGSSDFDQAIFKRHDFFEFRLDLAEIEDLIPKAKISIATCHSDPKKLIGINSSYIDLDRKSEKIETNALIIRSLHDFEKTPPLDQLLEFIHGEDDSQIKKIACKINSPADTETLLSLHDERDNLVIVGMGDPNFRKLKTKSLWTYASYGLKTAPGQIEFDEMPCLE